MSANTPKVDITSQTWAELRTWLRRQEEIEVSKLRDPKKDIDEVNLSRGSLLVIKAILGFEDSILKEVNKAFN